MVTLEPLWYLLWFLRNTPSKTTKNCHQGALLMFVCSCHHQAYTKERPIGINLVHILCIQKSRFQFGIMLVKIFQMMGSPWAWLSKMTLDQDWGQVKFIGGTPLCFLVVFSYCTQMKIYRNQASITSATSFLMFLMFKNHFGPPEAENLFTKCIWLFLDANNFIV